MRLPRNRSCWVLSVMLWAGCGLGGPSAPDGDVTGVARVVFVRDNQIFSSGPSGTHLKALTDPGTYHTPVWSPDGTQVAFLRQEGLTPAQSRVFVGVVDAEGQEPRDVFEGRVQLGSLSWSPAGQRLLFITSASTASRHQLVLLTPGTGQWHAVPADSTQNRLFSGLSWSPDGNEIFFSELVGFQWDIFSAGSNGQTGVQVTNHPQNDIFPSVSPDGTQVAFFSDRSGVLQIYVKAVTGGLPRLLTDRTQVPQQVRWSADGKRIAFVGEGQVHTIAFDGTDLQQVTNLRSAYLLHSWSPDGTHLAFRADLSLDPFLPDTYELYVVNLETREQVQILDLAPDADILWAVQ